MNSSKPTFPNREEEKEDDLRTAIAFENDPVATTYIANEMPHSKPEPVPLKLNEQATGFSQSVSDIDYFDSLIRDLVEISRLLAQNPSLFQVGESRCRLDACMGGVYAAWTRLLTSQVLPPQPEHHGINQFSALKRTTPPKSGSSSDGSPLNNWRTRSSLGSQGLSPPLKWRLARGDLLDPIDLMGCTNIQAIPVHVHKLEKKVFIPEVPNYNFIGRILGPRGISARQIEAEANCKLFIRGKGSMKDQEKEKRFINQTGYEHLRENLHVHITTEAPELVDCQRRMDRAVSIIESLLTPAYDEYKRTQLLQLAIMNGNYRPYKKKHKK